MDLARSVQVVTEEVMMKMARHVHAVTGMKHLCLAGGVALNCVANGRILREGPYEDLWIQPAAGDAGGALGACLEVWHRYLGHERRVDGDDAQKGSYFGPAFSDDEIEVFLKERNAVYERLERDEIPDRIASLIESGNVIGWHQGRMEFGPRALGSRSILGDSRSPEMQTKMNLKIKFRESFRPFAPTVLAERVSEWFELDRESPYMLLVADVKHERLKRDGNADALRGLDKLKAVRSEVPAITHVDNSARVQSVRRDINPLYHAAIEAFERRTGCPVIINTSFNVRGEPIVCTPREAYTCFMRTNMDFLMVGSFLLDKRRQPDWVEHTDWREEFELD
jgi:carbamoyltransferase